jgi:hypothetical protein
MKDSQIVALTTFVLFSAEAYGHYLIAKNEGQEKFTFYIPSIETTVKNLMVVGVFSLANGYAVSQIKKLI